MKNDHRVRVKRLAQGFTLLELMVVIVLVGVLIMIAVPSIQALSGLDLKKEITKIAGLSSEIYARAAITGNTHRIVFDLDEQAYWVEKKTGDSFEIKPELGYRELMKSRIAANQREQDIKDRFIPQFEKLEGSLGEKFTLKDNMVIRGAWTDQIDEVARLGQVSIYFFSGGYSQSAFVSLAFAGREERSSIYIALSPLTGAVEIDFGEPNIDELLNVENDEGAFGE